MLLDELEDAGTLSLPSFRRWMLPAKLSQAQGIAHLAYRQRRNLDQIDFRRADPVQRLLARFQPTARHVNYPQIGIRKSSPRKPPNSSSAIPAPAPPGSSAPVLG